MAAIAGNKRNYALLLLIVIAAAYVRLVNLGVPSFWVDELNHVYAGKSLLEAGAATLPSGKPNDRALLYSYAVAGSFRLFGIDEFSARLPSALFGILAIPMVFFLARSMFNARVALLSSFLLAFAHNAIGWSRACRMYTLFQFLFLIAVYAFWRGFEHKPPAQNADEVLPDRRGGAGRYFRAQGLHLGWLLASLPVFLVSYTVHPLTALFGAAFLAYAGWMFAVCWLNGGVKTAVQSKYGLVLGLALAATLVGTTAFGLLEFLQFAVKFQPAWARYDLVTDTHYYYWFLTESAQFPLAALFLIGALHVVTRQHKHAFFACCVFAVPAFLLSFVFAYRVHNYIFNIYPFFLMIAAFGLDNLYTAELPIFAENLGKLRTRLRPGLVRAAVLLLFFGWLPLTVWFRYAWKLPTFATGMNGAIDFLDWRDAASFVRENWQNGDVLITTLPLTMYYYLGHVEYNLNRANLDPSLDWGAGADGAPKQDFYTGAADATDLDTLEAIIQNHVRGWIVLDSYRMQRDRFVPSEIAQFIESQLFLAWQDPKNTVRVYGWSHEEEVPPSWSKRAQ